ncbi:MAG: cell division protein FtsW [Planctomycetes bacterium]|nr:cell division protein FtsW [Planctomycetota bacterium]MBI3833773.1 cell division protein FtsW [Planctomycetota bacterium]
MPASTERTTASPVSIIIAAMSLIALGVVMVASASASLDRPILGPGMWTGPFGRQLIFILVGIALMLGTCRIAPTLLGSQSIQYWLPRFLFVLTVAALAVALIPGIGDSRNGSQRWLRFTPGGIDVGFQPSEVAKLALILMLASLLGGQRSAPRTFFKGFVPATIVTGVCVGLVGKENLGTAALLAAVAFTILLVAGCRVHYLLILVGLACFGLLLLLYAAPYRLDRVNTYKNLWADAQGKGYQPIQSLLTIASGNWFGTGLGTGLQKYGYLPESHSDFVFAVVCEELGIFGGVFVILLFCGFAWLGLRIMTAAATRFERVLAFGLTILITLQAILNIAVVTVVAPTTGVPLPFVSAGGSGIFITCTMVGLLAAIAARGVSVAAHEADDEFADEMEAAPAIVQSAFAT